MEKEINFGIGFVTGRSNVCNIINSYYNYCLEQLLSFNPNIKLTIFIMYDLSYNYTTRMDFYSLIPDIYRKNIRIKYISPEDIEEEKGYLQGHFNISQKDADMFLGAGHAKGRNTVMWYALKKKMDYLYFWDDDEYPVAVMKDAKGKLTWKMQNNLIEPLKYMQKEGAQVTRGYHCGYIAPIPYIELDEELTEKDLSDFISSVAIESVNWPEIKERFEKDNGVTFADPDLASGKGAVELKEEGNQKKWVAGSTLCLDLRDIDKIPAFYNPPGGRGEDTFFSVNLTNTKVMQIPVYHFHDGFLKYQEIMKENYPKKLKLIESDDSNVEQRFLKVTTGWIKYKPLLMYIQDRENYRKIMDETKKKLNGSIKKISKKFEHGGFAKLPEILAEYDERVEYHYQEFLKTNEIWDDLKHKLVAEKRGQTN